MGKRKDPTPEELAAGARKILGIEKPEDRSAAGGFLKLHEQNEELKRGEATTEFDGTTWTAPTHEPPNDFRSRYVCDPPPPDPSDDMRDSLRYCAGMRYGYFGIGVGLGSMFGGLGAGLGAALHSHLAAEKNRRNRRVAEGLDPSPWTGQFKPGRIDAEYEILDGEPEKKALPKPKE